MIRKASILVARNEGKVLAVSRRPGSNLYGFPGGMIEEWESPEEACIREIKEETNLNVTDLKELFVEKDDTGTIVYVFSGEVFGDMKGSSEGDPGWVDWSYLFDEPFGGFNKIVYSRLCK